MVELCCVVVYQRTDTKRFDQYRFHFRTNGFSTRSRRPPSPHPRSRCCSFIDFVTGHHLFFVVRCNIAFKSFVCSVNISYFRLGLKKRQRAEITALANLGDRTALRRLRNFTPGVTDSNLGRRSAASEQCGSIIHSILC